MPRKIESHSIPGPAGILEALLEEPDDVEPREACLICHPHPARGGTMQNKVVYRMAHGLRRSGRVVLRFNFRGVGRSQGVYGEGIGELEDARTALAWLRDRYPGLPFSLAGFSFGSRIILRLGCATEEARCLIAVGFPTWRDGIEHLATCQTPKIFIQSTRDDFGPKTALTEMVAGFSEPKRLIFIDAGDHFFAGSLPELEDQLARLP